MLLQIDLQKVWSKEDSETVMIQEHQAKDLVFAKDYHLYTEQWATSATTNSYRTCNDVIPKYYN